jgi:hypothetical protein
MICTHTQSIFSIRRSDIVIVQTFYYTIYLRITQTPTDVLADWVAAMNFI